MVSVVVMVNYNYLMEGGGRAGKVLKEVGYLPRKRTKVSFM